MGLPRLPGACLALTALVAGCVSPVVLEDAVLAYDRTLARVRSQVLLLNIARARAGLPLNASEVTALTATFEFEAQADASAGVGPLGGAAPATGDLSLGVSARVLEAPTLSIVPLQGEAFTRRLVAPIDDVTFEFLHHRDVGVSLLLRLLAEGVVVEAADGARVFHENDPDEPEEFAEFRRRALHLESLARSGHLDVGPIPRVERWRPPPDAPLDGLVEALEAGFDLEVDAGGPLLTREVDGRILIANYDPRRRPEAERLALEARARAFPAGFVLVDVRPDGPGGDYPLQGWIKLRSLSQVLDFVGRGVDPTWERAVAPHPATRPAPVEPARTLVVHETTASAPDDAVVAVELEGRWLWIPRPSGGQPSGDWNLRAWQVLTDLYHLTTRNPGAPLPTFVAVGGGH